MKNREELAKEYAEKVQEIREMTDMEEMVFDNKIEFDYKDKKYRVRKPTYRELKEIEEQKIKKQMELLQKTDENGNHIYLFEEQLIEKYADLGIKIKEIQDEMSGILYKTEDLMLKLAVTNSVSDREKLRNMILALRERHAELAMKKADYLSNSIENQIQEFSIMFTLFLVLEEKVEDKWNRVFSLYEDMINSEDTDVIDRGLYFLMKLMHYA